MTTTPLTGQIVILAWEDGHSTYTCGLNECPCPEHTEPAPKEGTYVTIRLSPGSVAPRLDGRNVTITQERA